VVLVEESSDENQKTQTGQAKALVLKGDFTGINRDARAGLTRF